VTPADFERAQPGVEANDIVIIYSAEKAGTLEEFIKEQTYVTPDGAEWLVSKGSGRSAWSHSASKTPTMVCSCANAIDPR
jgi:hypothetical protein